LLIGHGLHLVCIAAESRGKDIARHHNDLGAGVQQAARNNVTVKRVCVVGSTIGAERVDRHLIGDQRLEIPIMRIVGLDSAGKMALMRDYFDSRLAL
jgi:limonene-1,2-epoxide hydrolase